MKLPIEWLNDFIQVPGSVREVADTLVNLGIGVEGMEEDVLDLEITANRGDLLSVLGIARELHVKTGQTLKKLATATMPSGKPAMTVTADPDFAPRYTTTFLRGVTVGPTKNLRITRRLKLAGMRPVNNIVDCTNYVMLELGQPTHAFDYKKVRGETMTVRKAKKGEMLVTLDGISRKLPEGSFIIADSERVIDLPGIMGGENSEIDQQTSEVVLQAAAFDPKAIRKTSKVLGLSSEASYRFERQVDSGNCLTVLGRLVKLVQEEAGGRVTGVLDINHTKPREPITLPLAEIDRLVGTNYDSKTVGETLERLGCHVSGEGAILEVTPPTWRPDLTIAADLVEEITRVAGFSVIRPSALEKSKAENDQEYFIRETLKDELAAQGLSEVMTYSLVSERDLGAVPKNDAVAIANPLSPELGYFRPSLLPGLLKVAVKNPTYDPIQIFEIGRVATTKGESVELGMLFAGKGAESLVALASKFGLTAHEIPQTQRVVYKIRKQKVYAAVGPLGKSVQSIKPATFSLPTRFTVKPISKYPSVSRDISVIVDTTTRTDEIKTAINESSESIHLVELFDEFVGPQIGAGKKSLAFHIHYQHPDKTMTTEEIDELHGQVVALLTKKFAAKVR